jgi:sugar/nucleoside kinase (ribokinase family)
MYDIVGIGLVLVDELTLLPKYPEPDTKLEIIDGVKQVGGPVPTALRLLSKLGLNCHFIGKVGTDDNSRFIESKLAQSGLDISGLIKEAAKSGFSQVWTDVKNKTRTIAYSKGTLTPFSDSDFNFENLPQAKILHIDGFNNIEIMKTLDYYKDKGTKISIDADNFREETLEILNIVDFIVMPKRSAVQFLGDYSMTTLVDKMKEKYQSASAIVLTDGVNGSVCNCNGKTISQKAFDIDVVDTTGAGDIHAGGLIYGLFNEWGMDKSLQFASACAALKCKHIGNETLPDINNVKDFLKNFVEVGSLVTVNKEV